jgi:hypothetical protein
VSRFAVDYCLLTSLQAHAVPLTDDMVQYLKQHQIIGTEAERADIESFLVRQIAAKDAFEFYALLRRESESARGTRTARRKPHSKTGRNSRK